ncbi:MAG: hypothetical protein HQK53_19750, partial [Oligoflexia bacterium]|nr:hypothetical protein [Oligoflexia bacterium]
ALLNYFLFSTLSIFLTHHLFRKWWRNNYLQGGILLQILFVGNSDALRRYVEKITKNRDAGVNFVGWKDGGDQQKLHFPSIPNFTELNLECIISKYLTDIWVIGYSGKDASKIDNILQKHYGEMLTIEVIPDLSYAFIGHKIQEVLGIPMISINNPQTSGLYHLLKRIFDKSI